MYSLEHLACIVYKDSVLCRNVVLLDKIVELGKHSDEVDAVVGNSLVHHALEDISKYGEFLAYKEVGCTNILQLVEEGYGAIGCIAYILVYIVMFHFCMQR